MQIVNELFNKLYASLTGYWVSEMLFEPFEQAIQRGMHPTSVAEPIRCNTNILHSGLNTGKIPQEKLPGEFLGGTQQVWDSLRGFPFLSKKVFFQFSLISVHCAIVLVIENFSSERSHWLDMACDYFVKIFKFLKFRQQSYNLIAF